MKLSLISAIALLSLSITSTAVFADSKYCDGTRTNPCTVQDTDKDSKTIKHWRTSQMMADAYKGNTTGLSDMWVSGSGAVSAKGYKQIAKNIDKATNGKVKNIVDLDLREETHGFLNNNAITLTDMDNWINLGKTYQQSLADEQNWLQTIALQARIDNVLTSDQLKAGKFTEGVNVPVENIQSEQQLVEQYGFEYHRLTTSDHMAPRVDDVDRFVALVDSLPSRTWLHMHCRGGDGRSTTYLAMFDMLKNADKVSFNDIIKRQASVDPNYDLSDVSGKNPKYSKYYLERYQFMMHFYQFANAHLQGYKGNWSDWIRENPVK